MDDYTASSPDPLAGSTQTLPPRTTRSAARKSNHPTTIAPPKLALNSAMRRTKSTAQLDSPRQTIQLQSFVLDTPQGHRPHSASPTKSSVRTENHLSPWRIRVTVEAKRDGEEDSGDGAGNASDPWNQKDSSPTRGRGRTRTTTRTSTVPLKGLELSDLNDEDRGRTRTKTMTVPVKGLESSPPATQEKRPHGRPRKSGTPAKPRTRNGTPVRARNGTPAATGRRKTGGDDTATEGEEEGIDPFKITPKKMRGRPRKPKTPAAVPDRRRREGSILDMERDEESALNKATTTKKSRGRKSLAIEEEADSVLRDLVGEEEVSEITIPQVVIHPGFNKLVASGRKSRGRRKKDKAGGDIWTTFSMEPEQSVSLQSSGVSAASGPFRVVEPEESISLQTPAIPATAKSARTTPVTKKGRGKKKAKSPVQIAVDPDVLEDDEQERDSQQEEAAEAALADVQVNRPSSRSVQSSVSSVAMVLANAPETLPAVTEDDFGEQLDVPWEKLSPAKKTPVKTKQNLSAVNAGAGPSGSSANNINNSLITPEDTPSPQNDRPSEGQDEVKIALQRLSPQSSSSTYSVPDQRLSTGRSLQRGDETSFITNMRSSPPQRILDYSFPPPMQQTPSIVLSSPSLPPPLVQANNNREGLQTLDDKSNLSPNSKEKTPRLARIVRAGIALQGALTTVASRSSPLGSPFTSPAKARVPDPSLIVEALFSGFGSGTRRELRVGLKFGEELARRQIEAAEKKDVEARSLMMAPHEDDVFCAGSQGSSVGYPRLPTPKDQGQYALKLPGQSQVEYPALKNPEDISSTPPVFNEGDGQGDFDDGMSWRIDTPVEELPPGATVEAVTKPAGSAQPFPLRLALLNAASRTLEQVQDGPRKEHHDDTESAVVEHDRSGGEVSITLPTNRRRVSQQAQFAAPTQEQEARWKHEQEAISRQIQMANKSRVIVIDSDDEIDENEQSRSSIDPEEKHETYRTEVSQNLERQLQEGCHYSSTTKEEGKESVDLNKIFSSDNAKPPRGKIPSPWRGNRDVVYSDEVVEYWNGSIAPGREEPGSPPEEEADYEEEDTNETMSPVHVGDLSTLLGLKSSPIKFSSEGNPTQPKTLRQRLLEKFTAARQVEEPIFIEQPPEKVSEPPKTKNNTLKISGNLVLARPSEDFSPYNDETMDNSNLHIPGLFGASYQDSKLNNSRPAPRRRVRSGNQDSSVEESFSIKPSQAKQNLTVTTGNFAQLTLGTPASPSDGLTSSSPLENESPLLHKGAAAAKPKQSKSANPLANSKFTWEKHHWTHLDNLWVQVKLLPPTYSEKNLAIRYPTIDKIITLSDAEMDVADKFIADVMAANRGREDELGEELIGLHNVRKRVGNLRYGEMVRRARGEIYDDKGRWIGKGKAGPSVAKK